MRTCTKCKETKPLSEFGTYSLKSKPSRAGKPHSHCRTCRSKHRRLWNRGITAEELQKMLDEQQGRCYLCGAEEGLSLKIDHNHQTGKARKLLCNTCNWKVGILETTDPDWWEKARRYIDDI